MDVQHLRNAIQAEIDLIDVKISKKMSDEDLSCSSDIDSWNEQKSAFQNLLAMDIKNRTDFETVKWIFNGGNLRTEEELESFSNELKKQEDKAKTDELVKSSKRYRTIQLLCQTAIIWVPIFIPAVIGLVMSIAEGELFGIVGNFILLCIIEAYVFIPLEIVTVIVSVAVLRHLDNNYHVKHDKSEDLMIAGVAAGMIATYYIKTKGSKRSSHKEI